MTRQQAINAKCKDCIYDPLDTGTCLKQTELCTMEDCSLYPYRPIPQGSKPKNPCVSQAKIDNMAKARANRGK